MQFSGSAHFRHRVALSQLTGKPLTIREIRQQDEQPGLSSYEGSFLRLVEQLSDGAVIQINETGTRLSFRPGGVIGGKIRHDCGGGKAIGWFIEGILPIALFGKFPLQLTLSGVTNDDTDISIDILRNVTFPLLQNFGVKGLSLEILRRGAAPNGGGEVVLHVPVVRALQPIDCTDMGLIKRVRGVAYCSKISPSILARLVDASRGVLNQYLPDVYIHTDHYKGKTSGASAGYAIALYAESSTGVLMSTERAARRGGELPEDIGREAALRLLEEVWRGGVVDSTHQPLVLMMMVLGPEDVSKVRFGQQLTDQAIEVLRLLRVAFGVVFKIKQDKQTNTLLLSCLGVGYSNVSRRAT